MELVAEAKDFSSDPRRVSRNKPISFRFVGGVHAGAEHRIRDGEWLLLGTADDCDVLLGDSGLVAHHCLIGATHTGLCVRSLEAEVTWDDIVIPPGEVRTVRPQGELGLGNARIQFMGDIKHKPLLPPAIRHFAWIAFSLFFSAVATYMAAMSFFGNETTVDASESVKSYEVQTVDRQAREKAEQEEGSRMASSLRDIMRLSGIDAETRYQRDGTVEVIGNFGDGNAIANTVQSRAVREIRGLKRVQVINKSMMEKPPVAVSEPPAPVTETKMVKIIFGSDPYLVVTDGSRYYPGARLPNGSSLVSILDKEAVLVKAADGEETLMSVHELF